MNYLRNKLVPTEIRNDINTLKSDVNEIKTKLTSCEQTSKTALEQARAALQQQTIKTEPVAKAPFVFEPPKPRNQSISFLDQIKKGVSLKKPDSSQVQRDKPLHLMDYVRKKNGFAEEMERRRRAIQPVEDNEF